MKLPGFSLRLLVVVLLLSICAAASSQVTLSLIPQPKQVETSTGFFDAGHNIKVGIGNYHDSATLFAANQLLQTLGEYFTRQVCADR